MAFDFLKRPKDEAAVPTEVARQAEAVYKPRIGEEQIREAIKTLTEYKSGKSRLDQRLIASEQWWKMRHWEWMNTQGNPEDPQMTSAWLFNTIISKHADGIQSYPQPNILPREESDKETAKTLSAVIPCVLEQNEFEETYSDVLWQKLKQGTGIYGIFWEPTKLNGLGDISIRKVDALNLYWEPGITDIQKSENVFYVTLVDNKHLEQMHPELKGKLNSNVIQPSKYIYDDNVDTTNKSAVVEWYYHTYYDGKKLLHYCKFVGDTVLYASENDTEQPMAKQQVQLGTDIETGQPVMGEQDVPVGQPVSETGWYAHGMYPFVFDRLFPVEGTPCGFGYIDVCKNTQEQIDLLNQSITINALMGSRPRFIMRTDGGINEAEFADWRKPIVHTSGNLGEDALRQIDMAYLDSNYVAIMNNKVTEMKETTGNTDASNGVTNGVTSASGIAAQQEASGKTSKAATLSAYRAFGRLIDQVIELIRQFYDAPRMFRITGEMGEEEFVPFDNSGMGLQFMGNDFGEDMYRMPVFDVKVSAQSKTIYTQNSQNELAVSLYNLGVFNPQNVDQSLLLLDTMDFEGKDELSAKVSQMGTIYQMFAQVSQIALGLAQQYDPMAADMLAQIIMGRAGQGAMPPMTGAGQGAANAASAGASEAVQGRKGNGEEIKQVRDARARAQSAAEVK